MNASQQIAQVVRQVAQDMAKGLKDAKVASDQDTGTDMICSMVELSRLLGNMTFEEARATILDDSNPARTQIVEALASKGIFL